MVGRAVLVRGPPHGGACCVGARGLRWCCVVWWCLAWVVVVCWVAVAAVLFASPGLVLCWCVPSPLLGRAVFVRGPPHGGMCCVGVCPPPWCGVLRWFVPPLMVGRAVVVHGPPLGGACCVGGCPPRCVVSSSLALVVVVCWAGCGCGCVVCLAGVGAVLVRAPPLFWGVPCSGVVPSLVGRAVSACSGFCLW